MCIGAVMGTWPMWGGEPTHQSVQLMKGAITSPVIKWRFATGADVEWQYSAIADVDGDGKMEVVVGSYDNKVYCLRGSDGTQKWAFTTGGWVDYSSPAVADCDGDGKMEVVVGSEDHKVYCLRGSDGAQKWAFTTGSYVSSSPAIADVDGDGKMEVVVGSDDHKVYCLRGSDGTQKWAFTTGTAVHTPGALVDIDGDGRLEYLVPQGGSSTLYCLNAENGSVAWQIDLAEDVHSPFAGDIDGDECSEIIVGTYGVDAQGYRVFAIDDPWNTQGCGPLYEDVEESLGKGFDFRATRQGIYLFMPKSAQVSLTLYDAQGRVVQRLYDGVLSSGGHTFNPTLEAKRVYMVVLRYQGGMRSLKIVK